MNKEIIHDSSEKSRSFTGENKVSLFQENRGKRWTTDEDMYLLHQISFLSYVEIGRHLRRSENAVLSRLKKLAFHMIQNGEDPIIVQNNLRLSNEDMEQINNECFIYPRKTPGKFITNTKKPVKKGYFNTQQSQEMQILLEIRSMLRKLLSQDNSNTTSSKYDHPPVSNNVNWNGINTGTRFYDLNLDELEKRSEEFAKMN